MGIELGIFAGLFVAGTVLAFVGWRQSGDPRWASVLLPVVLGALAIAAQRDSAVFGILLVAAFGAVGWLGGNLAVGSIVGLVVVSLTLWRGRRLPSDLVPDHIGLAPLNARQRGAEPFLDELHDIGYRQVGALAFPAAGHAITASILVGPLHDRYATVTDAVVCVTSRFGHRRLVSRNAALTRLPPGSLDNPRRGGSATELDALHQGAIDLLRSNIRPDRIDPVTVTSQALADERRAVEWVRATPGAIRFRNGQGGGPLVGRRDADDVIQRWLSESAG